MGRTGGERREVKELRCARYGVYVGFGEGRGSMRRRGEKVRTRCGDEGCGRGAERVTVERRWGKVGCVEKGGERRTGERLCGV